VKPKKAAFDAAFLFGATGFAGALTPHPKAFRMVEMVKCLRKQMGHTLNFAPPATFLYIILQSHTQTLVNTRFFTFFSPV
jgi:hypothetical protein